ncbi:hypothetical protein CTEST_01550 [Corynebacterium testudinoris]|uniref:Uncharacterized protein n=1 Tax=Corynebacterium testudinoris TaxID=136857 RepID=A0A0G3H4W1_9CORY|nr:hypothetical protein CTEST_01550 [Corynebacterium testudinoris]
MRAREGLNPVSTFQGSGPATMSGFYRNNQIQSGDNYVVEVIP